MHEHRSAVARTTVVRRVGLLIVIAILSACSGAGPTTLPDPSNVAPPLDPAGLLRFSCGGRPFSIELLAESANAELAAHPAAAALRAFLQTPDAEGFLPASGWLLAGFDDTGASFVAQVAGDPPFVEAEVELQPGGWKVVGYGQCRPRAVLEGLNGATWVLDPRAAFPGPEDNEFVALVTETACAGGQSSEGRILSPTILYGQREVLVVFAVRPQPGEFFTCPGNPATRVLVSLEEPLGERRLLDGGVFPPHDPAEPWPPP